MARKRMFTKDVTDSDAFIEMSSATQLLYFHLNQGADDDGFNNQVQNAMFKAHASVDDLKVLMAKSFVIRFESGVIVIKHWRLHNTIRKDRYTPTNFQEELRHLGIKDGAYTIGCQTVAELAPQKSIGKNSIDTDKVSKDKEEKGEKEEKEKSPPEEPEEPEEPEKPEAPKVPDVHTEREKQDDVLLVRELYNSICVSLPRFDTVSDARRKLIKARLKTYPLEKFKELFEKAEKTPFLKGGNKRKWRANIDWLMEDDNFAKVLDGNYTDRDNSTASSFDTEDFFQAAIKRSYARRLEKHVNRTNES